jgi:hypothetical protein
MSAWSWLGVFYATDPEERSFLKRVEVQQKDDLTVRAAVLDNQESARFFGVPLARRGLQPVWLEIRWRMFKSFLLSSTYRYSPVSPLYVQGRSQERCRARR